MDYSIPADLWDKIIPLSALIGAVGGLIWDVGNAIRQKGDKATTGLDNMISLPRGFHPQGAGYTIDLGFLGPMLVGAIAGILLVLLAGRTTPGANETANALVGVSGVAGGQTSPQAAQNAADTLTTTQVGSVQLVILALFGGLGGWGLLQTLTTRASKLLEAAVGTALAPAQTQARKAVEQAAENLPLTDPQKLQLGKAAEQAVKEAVPESLRAGDT